jgi:hypothetical protein
MIEDSHRLELIFLFQVGFSAGRKPGWIELPYQQNELQLGVVRKECRPPTLVSRHGLLFAARVNS